MEAGARALGAKYFRENTGHFWGLLETRPYMRARQGLAETLWRLKRYEEAIEHYRELLHLNSGDNQGNRYALLDLLIQIERYEEARTLLKQYGDEWSAVWLYSRALLEFQKRGASAAAKKILQQAVEENPFVPAYLMGQKKVPNRRVDPRCSRVATGGNRGGAAAQETGPRFSLTPHSKATRGVEPGLSWRLSPANLV
jgi:tetratricopeptide (TPR) repeat protein